MSMAVIRALLGLACGAHLVLWVCDRRLTCLEGGRFAFPDLQDNARLSAVLGKTPPARPMGASLWGVFAMAAAFPGYLALAEWMRSFSAIAAGWMLAGSILFLLPGVAHHVFCGTVEWFYLRLGKTEEARAAIVEFFQKSAVTMAVCYAGCCSLRSRSSWRWRRGPRPCPAGPASATRCRSFWRRPPFGSSAPGTW